MLLESEGRTVAVWSMRCAARVAEQRPEHHASLRSLLLRGPTEGYGSGPRRDALKKTGAILQVLKCPSNKKRG